MFRNQRITGIIISLANKGEADRLLTVYSKELGKVKIIAKSVRKIASKLYGGTGMFNIIEIESVEGKTFRTMTDYRILKRLDDIKNNPIKTIIGYGICEIIDRFIEDEQNDNRVWLLLKQAIKLLNNTKPGNNPWLIHYQYFFWNLMSLLGYQPNIDYCYLCKKTLTAKDMAFNPVNGGIKCDICLQKNIEKYEVKITISAVKILRLIVNEKRNIIAKIKQAEKIEEELKRLSQLFLICH